MIPTMFYGMVLGTATGLIWALAVDARVWVSAVAGAVAGFCIALILVTIGKLARAGSNLKPAETYFVSNGILTGLFVAGGGIGPLVWLGRALFS